MTNFKRYLTLFIFTLFTAFSVHVWGATYTKETSSIAAGDVILIVYETGTKELNGISTTSTKYGLGANYTTTPAGVYELTVEAGHSSGTFSFKNGSDYLTWTSGNTLNKTTTKSDNSSWTVTFSSGDAVITNKASTTGTARTIRWNTGSPRFACYESGQTAVQIYKKGAAATYTVTYNNGGHGTAPSGTTAASVTLEQITGVSGYLHTGWTANQDVTVGGSNVTAGTLIANGATATLKANTTFTAVWAVLRTVTWHVNGSTYTTGDPTTSVANGGKVATLPTAPANDAIGDCANKFMGWSKKDGGSTGRTTAYYDDLFTDVTGSPTISANTDFYAVFATSDGTEVDINFGYTDWGKSSSFSGTDYTSVSQTVSGIDVTYTRNSGSIYANATAMRFYKSNDLTFEASSGITSIVFTGSGFKDDVTTDVGTCTSTTSALSWSGDNTSVTFSRPSGASSYATFTSAKVTIGGDATNYRTSCGATINAEDDYYITSAQDQKVKIEIPVSTNNFADPSTLSASITTAGGFSLVGWSDKSISAGNDNATVVVQYLPTAAKTTATATLTLSASPADNKSITIHGRSLPNEFAIVANSSGDFALAANMTGSTDSRKAQAVTIEGGKVKCTPAVFTYTLEGVTSARYATHGTAVRLKGYNTGKYLKAVGSDSNDFQNTDYEDNDLFEWLLITSDNTNYNIQCFDAATATATRMIRYRTDGHFGNYTKTTGGQAVLQILEVEASCMPRKVSIEEITHNSIKIKFQGTDASHTLVIKQGSTTVVNKTVTNGEVITGLTPSTDYTYTLTPSCSANCAVEGEFSTIAAPITITLHRDGKTETLTDVANPYTLPASVDICDGWTFAGWSASAVAAHSGSFSPVTQATANGDYYAVFQTAGGSTTYTKVTSNSGLIAGKQYVMGYSTGTNEITVAGDISSQVLTAVTGSTYSTSSSTISALETGAVVFTLGGSSGAWTLSKTTQKLGATVVKKLAWDNGTQTWDISISSGDATISNTNDDYGTMYYNTSAPRFTTYSAAGTTGELPSLFVASGGVEYSSTTDCKDCTSAGASFAMGNVVNKSTESASFTNAVEYTKVNTKQQNWTSSNTDVAEVGEHTGVITIKALGSTTITVTQALDDTNDPDNTCAVNMSYMLNINPPSVDVVEVTSDDKIIIEHDIDNTNSTLIVQEQETGVSGNVANDIFFSKYFEASSNMKLFAIYNGTTHNIDLSKLRVRSRTGDVEPGTQKGWSTKGNHNYIEFGTISKLGEDYPDYMLPPFTELIFWSNNYGSGAAADYNATLRGCISMEIGDNTYDFDDMKNGNIPNWYCLGSYSTYLNPDPDGNYAMVFNGDDPLILERTEDGGESWTPIDLLGAGTTAAPSNETYVSKNVRPTTLTEGGPVINGKIKMVTAGGTPKTSYDNEKYTINGHADVPLNDDPGGYWALPEGASMPLSTNRYYLMRKNTVKDGSDAVANNTSVFATLATEWIGEPVGGNRDADCYSGEMFSEVGQYDYSHYFETWNNVAVDEDDFQKLSDGTYSIHVDNLASHSCKTLRIKIADKTDPTDIKASVDYKVPIIVKDGTKNTSDAIFTGAGFGSEVCSTCDVAILDGATLEASSALSAIKEVRNVEVYAGGMLNIDGSKELTVKQLIMRSKDDVVSRAKLASPNFNRRIKTILFDKRITGTRWYWIALPYDWKMEDVKFRNGDDAVYNTDWWLRTYDGEQRATGDESKSTNWTRVPANSTLKAGKGYILAVNTLDGHTYGELRFPMEATVLDKDRNVTVPVNAWGATTSKAPNHLGWNLIGNPYLNDYEYSGLPDILTVGELWFNTATGLYELDKTGGLRYVVESDSPSGYGEYHQEVLADGKLLEPFKTYFVQIDGTSAGQERNIEFTYASEHLRKSPTHRAPKEYLDERENDIIWVPISLSNVLEEKDQTTFLVSDRFTDKYDMMDDLSKWRRTYYEYYTKPVLASRNVDGELAFNALPDSCAEAGIPLNYFAYSAGMYTIKLEPKYGLDNIEKAVLYDAVAQKEHDLKAEGEYSFSTERTDNTTRFTLYLKVDRHKVPTGFENIGSSDGPRKLLINGNVYIQRGNRIYDVTGKQVVHQ